MDLFNDSTHSSILPFDGDVTYFGPVITFKKAHFYYAQLMQKIEWENDKAIIFGKQIITKRKVAWYGEKPFNYTYSNTTKFALAWTKALLEIKSIIENKTGETFNSCLLNLYHNGEEGMAWHSDGEKDLKKNGAIASFSLGAERKFAFKHKETKQTVNVFLENGSLLIMKGPTQTNWLHRLPPSKKTTTPRINLTFRTIVNQ